MLEMTKEQLLMLNNVNRARALKYIALGLIKYKESELTNENNTKR